MAAKAPYAGTIRFSSADLPERDRLALWREVVARQVLRMDMEPVGDRLLATPELVMMTGRTGPNHTSRSGVLLLQPRFPPALRRISLRGARGGATRRRT
jgi:hypothetical protein